MKTNERGKNNQIKFRQSLFWDVDPKTIDPKKNAPYVIERILDFGKDNEVKWLWNKYQRRTIHNVVKKRRGLNKRTRALWMLLTAPEK